MRSRQGSWTPPVGRRWTLADAKGMADALGAAGGAIAPFAREHGVSAQRVRWWRDRVGRSEAAPVRFAPVRIVSHAESAEGGGDGAIEIAVGEVIVRVRDGFDDGLLRRVLTVVRSRP